MTIRLRARSRLLPHPRRVAAPLIAVALAGVGCKTTPASKPATTTTATAPPAAAATPPSPAVAAAPAAAPAAPPEGPVYFDYDAATLRDDGQEKLRALATWLQANPGARVHVTGHADERGTPEYNLALGDQRARAVHDYLVRLGVAPARLRASSRGEEQPATQGGSEDAWAKNRRAELELQTSVARAQ